MKRLCQIELESPSVGQEHTEVTGAVYRLLRGRGIQVETVRHAATGSRELEVRLHVPAQVEQIQDAEKLLRWFGGGAAQCTVTPDGLAIGFGDVAHSDHFELLGISHRELSYNALLGSAFRHANAFRSAFLEKLGIASGATDWRCDTQLVTPGQHEPKASGSIPDLVLTSRTADALVIIENKVQASEGYRQTERYSNPALLAELSTARGLRQPKVELVFLTPDKLEATSKNGAGPTFKPMGYAELLSCLPSGPAEAGGDALDALLRCLTRRIQEMQDWPDVPDDAFVVDHLHSHLGLVSARRVFGSVTESVHPKVALPAVRSGVSNNSNGPVFWTHWLVKHWTRLATAASPFGDELHMELQWSPDIDSIRVHLHHETHPYQTYSSLRRQGLAWQAHQKVHNEHHENLLASRKVLEEAGWKIGRRKWALASVSFDGKTLTVARLRERLKALAESASEVLGGASARIVGQPVASTAL